jgi:CheY-like chemotaxis protein
MNTLRPILFIEDSPDDVFFFRRVLEKTGVQNPVLTFDDGTAVVEYLTSASTSVEAGYLPLIIFTDLKMSEMGGIEFCRWLRGHPSLKNLSTFVLSGSVLDDDIERSKEAGTNGFLVKFPTVEEMANILRDAGGSFEPANVA